MKYGCNCCNMLKSTDMKFLKLKIEKVSELKLYEHKKGAILQKTKIFEDNQKYQNTAYNKSEHVENKGMQIY